MLDLKHLKSGCFLFDELQPRKMRQRMVNYLTPCVLICILNNFVMKCF